MLTDHLRGALRALRRHPVLTLLMVLALGLGIGACMTTLTVYRVLAADPLPGKSGRVFEVQLDAADLVDFQPGQEPTAQLTRFDAEALLRDARGLRQVAMSGSFLGVRSDEPDAEQQFIAGRMASADFFTMFGAHFLEGRGWTAQEEADAARVVVIDAELATRLFGRSQGVLGRELLLRNERWRVIGVVPRWRFDPHFFDLSMGAYGRDEKLWLPFGSAMRAGIGSAGSTDCWGNPGTEGPRTLNAPCAWVQYWVELPAAADAAEYRRYLERYSEAQRAGGRFQRPVNVRLRSVPEVLEFRQVLPQDVRLQTLLAFGFLAVCLINMAGLLLARTLTRAGEIGVRRALGARRGTVFMQFLVEAGVVGLLGALLGLGLALGGLWLVRQGPSSYAALAQMDAAQLVLTLLVGLASALLAGLLPAWRATLVSPAQQLKVH